MVFNAIFVCIVVWFFLLFYFVCLRPLSCVPNVALDCPYFIAPSVFSNVYFNNCLIRSWRSVALVEETRERGENPSLYHIMLYHRVYQLIVVQLMYSLVIRYQLIICWLTII